MAKLILTDEEKKTASCLDWDASIGRGEIGIPIYIVVKKIALKIDDLRGEDSISSYASVMLLIVAAIESGSEHSVLNFNGLVDGEKQLGDWEVTIRKIHQ